jgi:hypothetical protein
MAAMISSSVNHCLKLFNKLISNNDLRRYHDEIPENLWQEELGRFRIWAANIGAHQVGQSSLDYRLRDASHIKDQISTLLLALQDTFQDLEEVLMESPNDHEQMSDSEETSEIQQIYNGLVETINYLFRMAMLLRKPAKHDQLLKFKKEDVVIYERFDQQHVREKFPHADRTVSDRLGTSISVRRADLKYRERHHKKLGKGIDHFHDDTSRGVPSTYMSDTVASDFKGESNIHFDEAGSNDGLSQTSYALSMLEGRKAITIPPPPKDFAKRPFECPYCFVIITVRDKRSWARHIFRDIMPYVCVYSECPTPKKLYDTRRAWCQHLADHHIPSSPKESRICSLCHEECFSAHSLERHIGQHLEELALFAIRSADLYGEPNGEELENTSENIQNLSTKSFSGDEASLADRPSLEKRNQSRVSQNASSSGRSLAERTSQLEEGGVSLMSTKESDTNPIENIGDPSSTNVLSRAYKSQRADETAFEVRFEVLPVDERPTAGIAVKTDLSQLDTVNAFTHEEVLDRFFQKSHGCIEDQTEGTLFPHSAYDLDDDSVDEAVSMRSPRHHHSAGAAPQPRLAINTDRDRQRGPSHNVSPCRRSDSVSSEEIGYRDNHQRSRRSGVDEEKILKLDELKFLHEPGREREHEGFLKEELEQEKARELYEKEQKTKEIIDSDLGSNTKRSKGRVINFETGINTISRPARDDERDVMQHFAAHASHCPRCADPFYIYMKGGTLCDRGHAYARDVVQYIYSKAGKAYSVVDRDANDLRVQIEIPPRCDAVSKLLKAADRGLKIKSQIPRPVVSYEQMYPVAERKRLPKRRDGDDVLPQRREERERSEGSERRRDKVSVPSGRGDLYKVDEEERRQRREQGESVIVYAEPRDQELRRSKYYR